MRPLVPFGERAKAALFFYSILMILVWLFLCLIPTRLFPKHYFSDSILNKKQPAKLVQNQKNLRENWDILLAGAGFTSKSYSGTVKSELVKTRVNDKIFSWARLQVRVVLPAVATPVKLRRDINILCSLWKGFAESNGFFIRQVNWGYTQGCLWVRIKNCIPIQSGASVAMIAAHQITLIQPFRFDIKVRNRKPAPVYITGLLPSLNPQIPTRKIPDKVNEQEIMVRPNPTHPISQITANPRAAIIIDDIGYCQKPADEMLKIPAKLTWAILPFAPYTQKYLETVKRYGYEVILHLPLEAMDNRQDPGAGVIKREWSPERIANQLDLDLNSVQGAVGVNNHMGSAGTCDHHLMRVLMLNIKNRGLFFVDSLTNAGSVAEEYARRYQAPFARRSVFIDNHPDLESQKTALRNLIQLAIKDGAAIGIAHARPGSAQAITETLPEFAKAGVEIVPVSQLVKTIKKEPGF